MKSSYMTARLLPLVASSMLAAAALGADVDQANSDPSIGASAFVRQCALCHTAGKGEPNRFGPNLFGIVDRAAGSVSDFKYSSAFKSTASWTWSADILGAFISAPAKMIPGTRMGVFQGVADKDRDGIIAYLSGQK